MPSQRPLARGLALALGASGLAFALVGCDNNGHRSGDTTAGQKLDRAIEQTQRKTDELQADASHALARASEKLADASRDARDRTADATDAGSNAVGDAAITTSVNAALAKDSQLSALAIDVDTSNGKVVLHGTAPSEPAKERATQLAAQVRGVQSVDNQLDVKSR